MNTFMQKKEEQDIKWYLIDATDKVLGRIATKAASILRGKELVTYTPHVDGGAGVIIINADKTVLTGNKIESKTYHWHSGFPGGMKYRSYTELMAYKPEMPLTRAIKGMMPKNKMRKVLLGRLKVYAGEAHPHTAQKPETVQF